MPDLRGIGPLLVPHWGGVLPFRDYFDRANGLLGGRWQGGANWAIAGNEAVNSPAALAPELVTNGTFAANINGWNNAAPAFDFDTVQWDGAGALQAISLVGAGYGYSNDNIANLAGTWYRVSWDCNIAAGGNVSILIRDQWVGNYRSLVVTGGTGTGILTYRGAANENVIFQFNVIAASNFTLDNVSVKAMAPADLMTGITPAQANVIVAAEIDTLVFATQAGVVVNCDSWTTPSNFVLGYHDGENARLVKCVAGTYTQLVNAAAAYGAGRYIQVAKSGTSYSLYYNGIQIGVTQTIADAGIINNTRHGMFSTYSGNQLDNFSILKN